jgi:hypothetical protein
VLVAVNDVVPEPLTVVGLKLQVLSAGKPEQEKLTVPVKPSKAPTEKLRAPAPPGNGIVILEGLGGLMVKSGWGLNAICALDER